MVVSTTGSEPINNFYMKDKLIPAYLSSLLKIYDLLCVDIKELIVREYKKYLI